ncbi:MAG: SDR family oxidoreductase [Roseiarcus sp.]|jgi:short-subunit dehydrogenase
MVRRNGGSNGCVLVTGASAGIGQELAKAFVEGGFSLVLLARSRDKLRELAEDLKAVHGAQVTIVPADLNDPKAPQGIFDAVREKAIEVDILVNNAGVLFEGAFAATALEDHLRLLQVNVIALTALTRLFLGPMLDRKSGRILNVASAAAFMPIPSLAVYGASKAYVLSLTEALSEELKGTGVTATALCPGFTDTGIVAQSKRGRRIPSLAVMDAKAVAQEGYSACLSGRTVRVAGLANNVAVSGIQILPRWLVRTVGGLIAGQTT